jgi:menaquinone-9 beta-reductase
MTDKPTRSPPRGPSRPQPARPMPSRAPERLDADAVVVGGGPAGAAAATRLAARGFHTIVVDRAAFPRDKVCGDLVGPAALAELASLGVAEAEAFRATNKIRDCAVQLDGDQLASLPIPKVDGLPCYARVIPRLHLDAWILAAAQQAGATILSGRKVTAVERAADAVVVQGRGAAGPWQIRARLLLGADGSNSTIARALRGAPPPRQDRILAVRTYFDQVIGPPGQAGFYMCGDSFPGYYWLFPGADAWANVGVGTVLATYPQSGRNLRELLLRLIAEDPAIRRRLRGARMRGDVEGHPLTTYNPRLPLAGDRVMLLGDAAGLINPLNGEGIQYALQSARWAAEIASDRLSSGRLDAASLETYELCVHHSLRKDMAVSRLAMQIIRNRTLNPAWLAAVRIVGARARTDPGYNYRVACIFTGLRPAASSPSLSLTARTTRQAIASARPGRSRSRARRKSPAPDAATGTTAAPCERSATARETMSWAAGVGRALAEVLIQLIRSKTAAEPAGRARMDCLGACRLPPEVPHQGGRGRPGHFQLAEQDGDRAS